LRISLKIFYSGREMENPLTTQSIADLINEIRVNPRGFLPHMVKRLEGYEGQKYKDTKGAKFKSIEGRAACREALEALESSPDLEALQCEDELFQIAQKHCDDLSEHGLISHSGSDGSTIEVRVERLGNWGGKLKECIAVQASTTMDIVLKWLIDDGVKSRGDRKAILSNEFKFIGVGINFNHRAHKVCAVVVFVHKFKRYHRPIEGLLGSRHHHTTVITSDKEPAQPISPTPKKSTPKKESTDARKVNKEEMMIEEPASELRNADKAWKKGGKKASIIETKKDREDLDPRELQRRELLAQRIEKEEREERSSRRTSRNSVETTVDREATKTVTLVQREIIGEDGTRVQITERVTRTNIIEETVEQLEEIQMPSAPQEKSLPSTERTHINSQGETSRIATNRQGILQTERSQNSIFANSAAKQADTERALYQEEISFKGDDDGPDYLRRGVSSDVDILNNTAYFGEERSIFEDSETFDKKLEKDIQIDANKENTYLNEKRKNGLVEQKTGMIVQNEGREREENNEKLTKIVREENKIHIENQNQERNLKDEEKEIKEDKIELNHESTKANVKKNEMNVKNVISEKVQEKEQSSEAPAEETADTEHAKLTAEPPKQTAVDPASSTAVMENAKISAEQAEHLAALPKAIAPAEETADTEHAKLTAEEKPVAAISPVAPAEETADTEHAKLTAEEKPVAAISPVAPAEETADTDTPNSQRGETVAAKSLQLTQPSSAEHRSKLP
jgi:hypothetical protein